MTDTALHIVELGKQYHIGKTKRKNDTLRDSITAFASTPVRRARALLRGEAYGASDLTETVWALQNLNFEVKRGEVVGIIGRNGAGKSTLLKILSRITEPSTGYAKVYGRVGALLEVGTGFNPELTGRENIYLNAAILGMRRGEIKRKFDEIVAFAEVERFIDTPIKHYSSGMGLRLGFAVAAHLEPEILIVDEVLAVGDLEFQKKCIGKMEDVSLTGRTVLFVSHNMAAVTRLCSRGIWLEKGQLLEDGPVMDVVAHYTAHILTASATQSWTDLSRQPGRNGMRLYAVSLIDENDVPTSIVNVENEYRIRMDYVTEKPDLPIRFAVSFFTEGVCAFTTLQAQEVTHPAAGEYRAEVVLPRNILAEGDYSIDLSAFASRGAKTHYCRVKDVLAIQTFDQLLGTSARGDYAEGLKGIMRPLLEWKTYQLNLASVLPQAGVNS